MPTQSPPIAATSPPKVIVQDVSVPDEEVVCPENPDKSEVNETQYQYGKLTAQSDNTTTDTASDVDDKLDFQIVFKELARC